MVIVVAVCAAPRMLMAEPVDDDDVDRARRHYQAGSAYFEVGKFDDAVREFRISYGLSRRPDLLYNIGKAYLRKGDAARASAAFQEYLQARPDSIDRPGIELMLVDLQARIGLVRVQGVPAGAEILLDDQVVGRAPLAEAVRATMGKRRVTMRLGDGTLQRGMEIEVIAGREVIAKIPAYLTEKVVVRVVEVPGNRWFNSKLGWGLAASGLAVAVGGAALLGLGSKMVRGADNVSSETDYRTQLDQGRAMEISGVSLLAVGGAALVAAVAVFSWRARHPVKNINKITWLVPSGMGFVAGGTF